MIIFKLLIAIFVFLIFISLWGFYIAIRPFKITSIITPKNFNLPYENISFYTNDHILIKGWFIPSSHPTTKTIILMHGYPADKGDILSSRIFLHPFYNLLLFDFRYFGQSAGTYTTIGKNEVDDLLAAIRYLRSRHINEVGVWGLSLGGAVAIMAASQAPEIKGIVAESSYARLDWMLDEYYSIPLLRYPLAELSRFWARIFLRLDVNQILPAKAAENLKIPILIIHSKEDKVTPFKHALLLQKALEHNPKAEFIFTNLAHGELGKNDQTVIKQFFAKVF